jgi:hypothetical protein
MRYKILRQASIPTIKSNHMLISGFFGAPILAFFLIATIVAINAG